MMGAGFEGRRTTAREPRALQLRLDGGGRPVRLRGHAAEAHYSRFHAAVDLAGDSRSVDQRGFVVGRDLAGDHFVQPQQYLAVFLLESCDFRVGVSLCIAVDLGVQWNRGRRRSAVVADPLCAGRSIADAFGDHGCWLWFCRLLGRQRSRDHGPETGFFPRVLFFPAIS